MRTLLRNGVRHFAACVKADSRCYQSKWWKHPGFWAVFGYRFRRLRKWGPLYCRLLLPIDIMLTVMRIAGPRCELPTAARIGPGLFLPHPDGVIISEKCKIGSFVSVFQQVTLGCWRNNSPKVRSRAAIFAGAKVLGGITLGRGACVGANAVVTKDVPARFIATGVPATTRPMRPEGAANATWSDAGADPDSLAELDSMVFRKHAGKRERVAM